MTAKKKTVVNFVLDETGSMLCVKESTISGFNEYIKTLKSNGAGNILFTLTQFNSDRIETVYEAVPLKDVEDRTSANYQPNNLTPLYDAIAQTIHSTEGKIEGMKPKPKVICVIQTDGLENASKEITTVQEIRKLIERKSSDGWTFVFLGADQDAWAVGGQMGIVAANTMSYGNTAKGTTRAFAATATATAMCCSSPTGQTDNFYGTGKAVDSRDED